MSKVFMLCTSIDLQRGAQHYIANFACNTVKVYKHLFKQLGDCHFGDVLDFEAGLDTTHVVAFGKDQDSLDIVDNYLENNVMNYFEAQEYADSFDFEEFLQEQGISYKVIESITDYLLIEVDTADFGD